MPDCRISRVRFEALAFLPWAFPAWRGLSAGSHTSRLPWFAHSLVPLPRRLCASSVSDRRAARWNRQCRVPLPNGGITPLGRPVRRLLRGHYSSVTAPTDSFANPVWLFSPSALASCKKSSQVATSPCCPRDLPDVISANLSSDAWSPTTAVPRGAYTCFFLRVIGLPQRGLGRLPASLREYDFSRGVFRGCRHFFMFRPPSLLVSQVVPTAAPSAAGQPRLLHPGSVLRCLRTHRIC